MSDSCEPFADYVVLIPVYDDRAALESLITRLDAVFAPQALRAGLVIVDDGSFAPVLPDLSEARLAGIVRIDVVRLRGNLGHQRAIAVGLTYVHEHVPGGALIVMDGDGEDRPEDVARLIQRFKETAGEKVVFAERTRRSERAVFTLFYHLYRLVHYLLTGIPVRVGNFSIVPYAQLERLVVVSDLWNHYAAAIFSADLPRETIQTERGTRLAGRSKMRFAALVMHGLSAISVFSTTVGIRLLIASCCLSLAVVASLAGLVGFGVAVGLDIPDWVATAAGLLLVLLSQVVFLSFGLVIFLLSTRNRLSFLPIRDYHYFIQWVRRVFPPDA